MSKRKWRVMLTLEDDLQSLTPEQIQEFVKETLEDMGDVKVTRCEAVEVASLSQEKRVGHQMRSRQ